MALLDCHRPEIRPDSEQVPLASQIRLRGDRELPSAPSVASAPARLRNTPALVCDGEDPERIARCPLAAEAVTRADDADEGVLLHLAPEAGSATVVRNDVQCYRALASVGRRESPTEPCVLDVRGADVFVREEAGHVVVDVVTTEDDEVRPLRAAVRERLNEASATPWTPER